MNEFSTTYFDEKLISKVANNDLNALKEIYELSKTTIFATALSILKNKEDAEDILHDTYIKVYENASSYKSEPHMNKFT